MVEKFARKIRFYWNPRKPFERLVSLLTPIRPDQTERYFEKNLLWEVVMGRAKFFYSPDYRRSTIMWDKEYDDKAVKSPCGDLTIGVMARGLDAANFYYALLYSGATTADFILKKTVANVVTDLGFEAVDVEPESTHILKLSASNSAINAYREDMTTPKISVTDTTFTSGYWGLVRYKLGTRDHLLPHIALSSVVLEAPSSLSPQPIAFYKLPVLGSGTTEDPYRAQMPELIEDHPQFGKINKYALTHAAFIPTDRETGKPLHDYCVVKIYEHRADYLAPLDESLSQVEALSLPSSNPKLSKEEVISLLLEMDPKLTEEAAKEFVET